MRGRTLVVTINRQEARNAIKRAVSEAIAQALDRPDIDASLSVGVLTGAGGHFRSGMDFRAFLDEERADLEGRGLAGLVERPSRKPLFAAVEGYALADGCEIAHTGGLMSAQGAHEFGLVNRLVGESAALESPLALADKIAANGPLAVIMTKAAIDEAPQWPAHDIRRRQREILKKVIASDEAREGYLAFAEKRSSRWIGT